MKCDNCKFRYLNLMGFCRERENKPRMNSSMCVTKAKALWSEEEERFFSKYAGGVFRNMGGLPPDDLGQGYTFTPPITVDPKRKP